MPFTAHGYHIPGTSDTNRPSDITRCGGPAVCPECSNAVAAWWEDEGRNTSLSSIPAGYVSKYYEMNPDTEEILFDGSELQDGMIVLAESSMNRQTIPDDFTMMSDVHRDGAQEKNRWCMVKKVKSAVGYTSFIAIYADGTKRKRVTNTSDAWLVKLDSMIAPDRAIPQQGRLLDV